ncbi:MAG TPA: PH domain-containing protein [Stellaceae bacterium]|nr:PH domain-containing protein [Stellaceae bacterium]
MSYVTQVLQPGERVIAATRIHWWFLWRRTILLDIAAVVLAGAAGAQQGDARNALFALAAVALVLGFALAVGPAIARATTELAVTDRRIIHKSGFIRRQTIEMSRSQVESVEVHQGILGRLLNFGDITLHGTGTTPEPLRYIAAPLQFRSAITAG